MACRSLLFLLPLVCMSFLPPSPAPEPLITLGGGYLFAGSNHSGGVVQVEYRWDRYFLRCIRPQATLLFPEVKGIFVGVGIGLELYLNKNFILIPSFEPGLYYKGKSRNLGHPIEFRSSIEVAYENSYHLRTGCQFFHISNAHLGHHNPGCNALIFYLAIPTFYIFCN